MQHALRLS